MTSDSTVHLLSAVELARSVAAGELSAMAVARATLARIGALDADLRAWVLIDRDRLLGDAEALDRRAIAGGSLGPLHGVPVGVKDIYDVAGLPTRAGSPVLSGALPAERDATAVARLRAAGALLVGKTATTEFAAADPAETRNPWPGGPAGSAGAVVHTPGGSSSGSAVVVAAAMVPAALGSQTAGSILRPASFCGVVGFKPSFGSIPRDGVVGFAASLDTMGVLVRTVGDASLLFGVLTGRSDAVPGSAAAPRIGFVRGILGELQQPAMAAMLDEVAARFGLAGATVEATDLPFDFAAAIEVHRVTMLAEAATYHRRQPWWERRDEYGPRIRAMVEAGLGISAVAYLDAQRARAQFAGRLEPVLARLDALLVPAAPGAAPEGLGSTGDPAFNAPWTLLGVPAITLRGGFDAAGMPLGLQLVAAPGADLALLRVAAWCERVLGSASRINR